MASASGVALQRLADAARHCQRLASVQPQLAEPADHLQNHQPVHRLLQFEALHGECKRARERVWAESGGVAQGGQCRPNQATEHHY